MTEQTAMRVANEVCRVQLKAVAMLVADGVDPGKIELFPSNYGGHEHNLCGVTVDECWAAHVRWTEQGTGDDQRVTIELTWADPWRHLGARA